MTIQPLATPEETKPYELSQKDTGGQTFVQKSKNTLKDVEHVNKTRTLLTKSMSHHTRLLPQQQLDLSHKLHWI
jgi:hypothetical protein